MAHYDPVFGELLTSKEVSALTGFTLNQLRNQRQRPETSPFGWVRQGGTSWYRRDDIELWLESHGGGIQYEYVTAPNAVSAPLRSSEMALGRKQALSELARITTANAWSKVASWFTEQSGYPDPYNAIDKWMKELWALKIGVSPDEVKILTYKDRGQDLEAWWSQWVFAMRKATAEVKRLDVSDQEIINLPVGEVPPSKIQ